MTTIKLTIDGKTVEVEKGKTVLQAAQAAGIKIPTMCAHDDLPNYGACRMCIVQIENVRGFPTSCTTPADEGMVVTTDTPDLRTLRKRVLELMMSGHPNSCLLCLHREACETARPKPTKAGRTTRCAFCSNRSECELRNMTLDLMKDRDLALPLLYSAHNLERFDPFMDRDYNLCILCGRCWRICEKIHGQPAISVVNRGRWAKVGTSFNKDHTESGCKFCGACIDICPTATLSDRYAKWYGKPDAEVPSACALCPVGCEFKLALEGGKVIAGVMKSFERDSRLCALGRFAYGPITNASGRLRRAMIRDGADLIGVAYDDAVSAVGPRLKDFVGSFVAIVNESDSRETKHLYQRFATEAMKGRIGFIPAGGTFDDIKPASLKDELAAGKFKAALVAGDYLSADLVCKLEYLVVVDFMPTDASESASALFPAAVLAEIGGTVRDSAGAIKYLTPAADAYGDSKPEWKLISDLAGAMGADGFKYDSASDITPQIKDDPAPAALSADPRDDLKALPTRFRGHLMADLVAGLDALGLPVSPKKPEPVTAGEGFEIIEKREVVPNFHLLKIKAPQIARFAKPGQFVIVMAKETSERIPFTLADWDVEAGTITMVVEEVGRSSREVVELKSGGRVAHVTGPLGLPFDVKNYGTVALGGGCYGLAGIYPIAKALKAAGNRVISVIEASSSYLVYNEMELRSVSDEVQIVTKDGSRGTHGGIQEVFVTLAKREKIDAFVAIGCTFMMDEVSKATKDLGAPLFVALNPIMVDGTGMCGACRLSVGGKTKFACVDGPIFLGHDVDWKELMSRRGAYAHIEIQALPQGAIDPSDREDHHGKCTCGS